MIRFYGLNYVTIHKLNVMAFFRWSLWEVIRVIGGHESGTPMIGLVSL